MLDVLILPNNLGISHPLRSYMVGKEIRNRGYSVKIAYSGPYADLMDDDIRINGIAEDYNDDDYNYAMVHIHENPLIFPFGSPNKMKGIAAREIDLIEKNETGYGHR